MTQRKKKIEYGDFQTPIRLADDVALFLHGLEISPSVIVEPTCGLGSFVLAANKVFNNARQIFAFDINATYISNLRNFFPNSRKAHLNLMQQDFFTFKWKEFFLNFDEEILVLGNPPWVTNTALGVIGSDNLPQKSNFQNNAGFAAKTGKANFDISEWMLIKLLEALQPKKACLAMLCKTSTARKVLRHGWLNHFNTNNSSIHLIDAGFHFGVSVNACLLVIHTGLPDLHPKANVYSDLSFNNKITTLGLADKDLVANVDEYALLNDLDGIAYYAWRSGVKHDAANVMEFKEIDGTLVNGLGERVDVEHTHLYPLLKSSDLANNRLNPQRYVLLTQRSPSDNTDFITKDAPKTWAYLLHHAEILDKRQSIIYKKRDRFSVFGAGEYTFSPWKVAISGLYKNCRFVVIGNHLNKPVVLDDTCYSIPCNSEQEATFVCDLLNSDVAKRFLHSLIFFDSKRPVTIDVLNRIDLKRVAERLGMESEAHNYLQDAAMFEKSQKQFVFESKGRYRVKKL
jgi:hypothetical protein